MVCGTYIIAENYDPSVCKFLSFGYSEFGNSYFVTGKTYLETTSAVIKWDDRSFVRSFYILFKSIQINCRFANPGNFSRHRASDLLKFCSVNPQRLGWSNFGKDS